MAKDAFKAFNFASFSCVTDNHIKKFSTQKDTPEWRTVYRGLNLEGKCKNKECKAYNSHVWSPLGYGQFEIAYYTKNTPCVICGKNLRQVECAGIWKCQLLGKGSKAKQGDQTDGSDDEEEETNFKYQTSEQDSFLKFGDIAKEIIQWNYLILKSIKPKLSKKQYQDQWLIWYHICQKTKDKKTISSVWDQFTKQEKQATGGVKLDRKIFAWIEDYYWKKFKQAQ